MAAFEGTRQSDRCDHILYLNSGAEIPDWERHGDSAKVSVRYTVSARYRNEISDHANVINSWPKDKPSAAEKAVLLKAIDRWLRAGWEQIHRTKLSTGLRNDIARNCRNISSVSNLQRTLPKLSLIHSAVGPRAADHGKTIQQPLATVPQPVAPVPEQNPPIRLPRIQPAASQFSNIYSKAVIQNLGRPNSPQFQVARVHLTCLALRSLPLLRESLTKFTPWNSKLANQDLIKHTLHIFNLPDCRHRTSIIYSSTRIHQM